MTVAKVASKGRITIPSEIRAALGIDERSLLEVHKCGDEIRFRKVVQPRPLGDDDPIWSLIGVGETGPSNVAEKQDRSLADGEINRWRESS
jgi:transcriptional pleiotropic regulator of transition state genes